MIAAKPLDQDTKTLAAFLESHPRLVVLTGAGISVASGIPAYRDQAGSWLAADPIQHRAFIENADVRRRYWARSWYGWPKVGSAKSNPAHRALAEMESANYIELLITQNVDGLHQQAGSRNVVDLHGRIGDVLCMRCDARFTRQSVQEQLSRDNVWPEQPFQRPRPDGDMDVDDTLVESLILPACDECGGDLKPDVVFFGGSVPRARVQCCTDTLSEADALLVVGSSLKVFSGYRFVRQASRAGIPIAIINPGQSRGDAHATHLLRSPAGLLLEGTVQALSGPAVAG